ncbi:MAG: LacI family DNA-binding transcriptional regulator [Hyphomicrobiaceae bacterium]|nr:LacI family DNA-binding transcriptional regulator [Hyphomicrobiaceae bacterium]
MVSEPGPGTRVTIIDIARDAGVSKSTVSLVLKNSPLVKGETRERVLEAMAKLGYVYNRGAANLRTASSRLVGMVISDLLNPFFAELAVGLEEAFYRAGFVPILANTAEDAIRQTDVLRSIHEHGVAGLIISPAIGTDPATIRDAVGPRLPVVSTMRRLEGCDLPYVGPDNRSGARAAVAHLIALGHRRIAFVGGFPTMTTTRERLDGWRDALVAAGLPHSDALVFPTMPTRAAGAVIADAVLAGPDAPTAALCYNDIVAIGLIRALAERGSDVGASFGVIGFDDIAEARHNAPPLTTVSAETRHLGAIAADVLMKLILGEANPPHNVIGQTRLIVRDSCGAPFRLDSRRKTA